MALSFCGLLLIAFAQNVAGSVVTNFQTSGFSRWPNNIVYYTTNQAPNPILNSQDTAVLKQAMAQVSMDLGYCVNFTDATNFGNVPRVTFQSAFQSTGTPNAMCFTYPGFYAAYASQGQIATAFSSTTGNAIGNCLDNQRDAMKLIANLIGLQNEFQRPLRDTYMTLSGTDPNSLVSTTLQQYQLFNPTRQYTASQAYVSDPNFDYNSITMVSGARYAGTSQPVFSLPNGRVVGQQARLSQADCNALKAIYGCAPTGYGPTPTCQDPYTSSTGVTFSPAPSVISKSVQCSTTGGTIGAINLGSFLINGVGTGPTQQPALTYAPSIPGVTIISLSSASPFAVGADTGTATATPQCTAAACLFFAQFTLTQQPTRSYTNQQLTVTATTVNNGQTQTYSIPVTLNLNCAPQWQSATVYQIGITGALASAQTKTPGTGFTAINTVAPFSPTPTAGTLTILATNAARVPTYLVNSIVEFGTTGQLGTGAPLNTKVFVNCMGTLTVTMTSDTIGTTVIGQVSATDPDGGRVSYYTWTAVEAPAATANLKFDVTQDGVVTASVIRTPVSSATSAQSQPEPFAATPIGLGTVATTHYTAYITAVDSSGGASTLEFRIWPACGPST